MRILSRPMRLCVCLLLFLAILSAQGCAISWGGHAIPRERLDGFVPGKTTMDEVVSALGSPEDIVVKPADKVTIYVYKSLFNVFVGLPTPILSVGRIKQTGFVVNILFRDGLYQSYDVTELKQTLL